jgi:glutamate-1-semialdehyde 2,1-aminomutase
MLPSANSKFARRNTPPEQAAQEPLVPPFADREWGMSNQYAASVALGASAREGIAGGVNSSFRAGTQPGPLFFTHGRGAQLFDVDGNSYLDFVLGMGPNILGHAPASVLADVAGSLTEGQLFAGQHRREIELAGAIQASLPSAELIRLGQSGSEMVQAALRVARALTGRPLVLKFEGHYHGWFDSIYVSVAPPDDWTADAGTPFLQSAGQSAAATSDVRVIAWNDASRLEQYLNEYGDRVAALIMEPILCNTCVISPEQGFLARARDLCTRLGIVLIFDEVITGFRVGLGGAQGLLGVTPDLTVLAKALGGGFPIAALAGRRDVMEIFESGLVVHGGTYNANVPSVAAALATLKVLQASCGAAYERMNLVGARLIDGLRQLAVRHSAPLQVQGLPTVFNTYFSPDANPVRDYRTYATSDIPRQRRFIRGLQDRGVRLTARGTWFLSTAHENSDIDRALEAAEAALLESEASGPMPT